jgi:16S rRNA G1207 methylase RsmC
MPRRYWPIAVLCPKAHKAIEHHLAQLCTCLAFGQLFFVMLCARCGESEQQPMVKEWQEMVSVVLWEA